MSSSSLILDLLQKNLNLNQLKKDKVEEKQKFVADVKYKKILQTRIVNDMHYKVKKILYVCKSS